MSRILHVYLVDLAELAAEISSRDENLLNRILALKPEELSATCDRDDDVNPGELNTHALRAIFAGGPFDEEHAEGYVVALKLICDQLGPYIGDVGFYFRDDLPTPIEMLTTGMMEEDPFPGTPSLAESFGFAEDHGWGHMSREDCAEELEHWESAVADDPNCYNGFGTPIVEWLRASKKAGKDLIGFWAG
ncbi:hypothetical protein [Nocardia sp. NPDC058114]|uniref:DUF7691 family protein n=1 Tax=Nocardia sp. NPDC058114 TaxID=3346346 RepID=UPI0036D78126